MPPNSISETEPEPAPVSGAEPAAELETADQKVEETTIHHSKFREQEMKEHPQPANQRIAQVESTTPKTTTEA
ncbi:synaptotagmin 1-like, partial [Drosophila innubila]|uniref:synaptotagmin 1-like n=1 Tax=Drosophila innubila TaxID=198719 RepID=UPI00148DB1A9